MMASAVASAFGVVLLAVSATIVASAWRIVILTIVDALQKSAIVDALQSSIRSEHPPKLGQQWGGGAQAEERHGCIRMSPRPSGTL